MPNRLEVGKVRLAMYARAVDDAATRLHELRREEREDLALAALALGLALVATQVRASLALPLFLGGLTVGFLGMRALLRRWELIERLAGDRDAYVLPEVIEFASREAMMERRQVFAATVRGWLMDPGPGLEARRGAAADELEALASELEDGELELDPVCAVGCARLLSDVAGSPLLNSAVPPDLLRSRARQIRAGFRPSACRTRS
jgi:hypothetical protein